MDLSLILVIARTLIPVLVSIGKKNEADLLQDVVAAVGAGKNVDDIMKEYAQKWDLDGEPTFDDIAETRKKIQERLDG